MAVMVRGAVPVFVKTTICGWLVIESGTVPKESEAELKDTVGVPPVPEREITCGVDGALSLTLMLAERAPAKVGVNLGVMVQVAPIPRVEPQLLV